MTVDGVGLTFISLSIVPPKNGNPGKIINATENLKIVAQGKLPNLRIYSDNTGLKAEVLRKHREMVAFSQVLPALGDKKFALPVALGADSQGKPVVFDLAEAPHLLIAGTTGSGKSVAAHAILCSLLFTLPSKDLQLIVVDPKKVEMAVYKNAPQVTFLHRAEDVVEVLDNLVNQMEERNEKFEAVGARNLASYNAKVAPDQRLPRIVCYVDETFDLFLGAETSVEDKKEGKELRGRIENALTRLAQKARSAGIHLALATQKPTVEAVPSLLRGNLPS
ncbi:FtsK/SpoIIIE domain-containing protein [Sulfobacillus thermosulfidooxidans]|uniref:FtsK/SpoIIIE domain-containing protein n=1 Tax=Sulfobacillus thermosulfidooxidans TaxID=28034 RepID=UPI0006B40050|nr:FtsK/SpoIIIE domain-containing protein [Sulfobacillus thermosulfidooxidans]